MKKNIYANKTLVTIALIVFIIVMGLKSGSLLVGEKVFSEIASGNPKVHVIEKEFIESVHNKIGFLEANSFVRSTLGLQDYYKNKGVYVMSDGYIVGVYPETSTDYEYEQTLDFKAFLDDIDVNLIYVNEPIKYVDDSCITEEFGMQSYINANTDKYLERIGEAGVTYIDLRDSLKDDGYLPKELFYRTDHHWTVSSGKWAASKMACALNDYCGYNIDLAKFDDANYEITEYKNCWLGEQGKVVGESYVGLDDYTCIKPAYNTNYDIIDKNGGVRKGTFDDFVDESVYNTEIDVYNCPRWHYSYDMHHCINNDIANGKVLLLGDSYDVVTAPFLSLAVNEVDYLVLREYDKSFDLRQYIIDGGYDTVLVCYAQFMIGAHDDVDSANYRMFDFK